MPTQAEVFRNIIQEHLDKSLQEQAAAGELTARAAAAVRETLIERLDEKISMSEDYDEMARAWVNISFDVLRGELVDNQTSRPRAQGRSSLA